MIGKITPPKLDPVNAIPRAVPLFRWNHPAAAVIADLVNVLTSIEVQKYAGYIQG
jgi:hypothetical protein